MKGFFLAISLLIPTSLLAADPKPTVVEHYDCIICVRIYSTTYVNSDGEEVHYFIDKVGFYRDGKLIVTSGDWVLETVVAEAKEYKLQWEDYECHRVIYIGAIVVVVDPLAEDPWDKPGLAWWQAPVRDFEAAK